MLQSLVLVLILATATDGCVRTKEAENDRTSYVKLRCPDNVHRKAESRSTSAYVAWSRDDFQIQSSHTIRGIYQTVPIYGASASVNREFEEGNHYIEYKAVDESGNFDSCSFTVTVTVTRCRSFHKPQPGFLSLTCDANTLQGSRCTIQCLPGYAVVGDSQISCTPEGEWSNDLPFCRPTTCPDPGTPLHGTRFCNTATHAYGSFCNFQCSQGHKLVGNSQLLCKSDVNRTYWSNDTPFCEEITPPTVEVCPQNVTEPAASGVLTEVQKPLVEFRTSTEEVAPYTCSHFGDRGSHLFGLGDHEVTCRAFDPQFGVQSVAECKFLVRIKANPCRRLRQPRNGFLLCSRAHGGGSSTHDTTCRLFCNKGYALPRSEGSQTTRFECDHTGQWQPSQIVPSCVPSPPTGRTLNLCGPLWAIGNGADYPPHTPGWPSRPTELILPSEVFYWSSDCSAEPAQRSISNIFAYQLTDMIRNHEACERSPKDCIVMDVKTNCQDSSSSRYRRYLSSLASRRRVRTSGGGGARRRGGAGAQTPSSTSEPALPNFVLPVQFRFATRVPVLGGDWPDEYHKASFRLFGMFDYFEQELINGKFSIAALVTRIDLEEDRESLAYDRVKAICDMGYKFNQDILLCVPCGAGTRYDIHAERCEFCPAGTYQDAEAQTQCKVCPLGTRTVEDGTTNVTQCVDIDECESSPCLNHGHCQHGVDSFTCTCRPGFSGERCESVVYDCTTHACQNGGTCVALSEHNYTCLCRAQYSGEHCLFSSINGGWSEWSEWSVCSKSCEGGVRLRNRTCDDPIPRHGGENCKGAPREETVCNMHSCPECKRLRRPYQGSIKCVSFENDHIACTVSCPTGYAFSAPVFDYYICGRNTSYLWPHESPDNPRCIIPACAKVTESDEELFTFRAALPVTCTTEQQRRALSREINKRAVEVTSGLRCLTEGTCSLDQAGIVGCSLPGERVVGPGRRKRETPGGTGTEVTVSITYHGVRTIGREDFGENESWRQAADEIVRLGRELVAQSRQGSLYIELEGERVPVDGNLTSATNQLVCPRGLQQSPDGLHCVECSPGTSWTEFAGGCLLCEVGFYQPRPAQEGCTPCLPGMTTFGRGAVFPLECYPEGTTPPAIPEDYLESWLNSTRPKLEVILPIVAAIVFFTTAMVAIACLIVRKRTHNKYEVERINRDEPNPEEVRLYQKAEIT